VTLTPQQADELRGLVEAARVATVTWKIEGRSGPFSGPELEDLRPFSGPELENLRRWTLYNGRGPGEPIRSWIAKQLGETP
jgi:hypothetical protein